MKGIEKITNRIREEAEAEAAAVRKAAQEKAEGILNGYKEQAKLLYEEKHAEGLAEAAAAAERKTRNDHLQAKKAVLSVKHVLVKDAYRYAHKELLELPEDQYLDLLAGYAVKASSSGTEELLLNSADRARIGEKLVKTVNERLASEGRTGNIKLSDKDAAIDGGLILAENDIQVNCSLGTLVNSLCEELDRSVAGILFG